MELPYDLQGNRISVSSLPAATTKRWTANRKYTVLQAIRHGLITREAALERYHMREDELAHWERAQEAHGQNALRVTRVQQYPHVRTHRK